MGYQALLFCPDEKTARAVTQVLGELDFSVIPCTEPFGAVKKLMGEHFDAVVVDCDNEQNATLLFKSARNTPSNQSSLAVAVVEGQAGVAKAFRIGANLVLTKPINVEQAKGTLRVARGLLRKNEGGKPAAPATPAAAATVKPVKPVPAPPKLVSPAPNTRMVPARPAAPVTPLGNAATASIPAQKPLQAKVVASIPDEINESDADILEISDEVASASTASRSIISPSIGAPDVKIAASQPANLSSASSAGVGSGAASAAAPARETKTGMATDLKSSSVAAESSDGKVGDISSDISSGDRTSAPASAFTFGGNVSSDGKPAARGSKKTLLIVAAVVLVAAGGYALWMQWVRSSGAAIPFTQVAAPAVKTTAMVPHVAPSAAPAATPSATASVSLPVPSSTSDAEASSQATGVAKTSSNSDLSDEDDAEKTPSHPGKVNPKANSAKASAATADKSSETKAAAPAIVIKNDFSQKPTAKPAATPDAPAPSMTDIASAESGAALPNLMGGESKAPAPVLETLKVSQGVSRGLLVKRTAPEYPASAMQMHIEGAVELEATISKSGDISAVKVASGNPQLARAAVDAVKQWKYKPYLLNGEPVEIRTQITVNFKLPD
ncbi:MAG: TonB family protein [Candidatus Sulfotelmatobacter sp.]